MSITPMLRSNSLFLASRYTLVCMHIFTQKIKHTNTQNLFLKDWVLKLCWAQQTKHNRVHSVYNDFNCEIPEHIELTNSYRKQDTGDWDGRRLMTAKGSEEVFWKHRNEPYVDYGGGCMSICISGNSNTTLKISSAFNWTSTLLS